MTESYEGYLAKANAKAATKELFETLGSYAHAPDRIGGLDKALAKGAQVNARSARKSDGVGARPLHLAAAHGDPAEARRLIAAGAKLELKDENGRTPLHWASRNAKSPALMVAELVAAGADIEARDKKGATPLGRALESGASGLLAAEALLAAGASWDSFAQSDPNPIHRAAERLDVAAVSFMIANGAPVGSLDKGGRRATLALMEADAFKYGVCESEQTIAKALSVLELLLGAGVPLSAARAGAKEPLMAGLCGGAPEPLLTKARMSGASVSGGSEASNCQPGPAHLASMGKMSRLALAFSLGLDVNWADAQGNSLCYWAMQSRSESMFETLEGLLKAGCDPRAENQHGEGLLQAAIAHSSFGASERLVQILLDHGADPNGRSGSKRATPMAIALRPGVFTRDIYARPAHRVGVFEALAKAGANLNATTDNIPLLCHAEAYTDRPALLRLGADPTLAALHMSKVIRPEDVFNLAALEEWIGMGARPEALLEGYPAALRAASSRGRHAIEESGALAYLEALALKNSLQDAPAPSHRGRSPSL